MFLQASSKHGPSGRFEFASSGTTGRAFAGACLTNFRAFLVFLTHSRRDVFKVCRCYRSWLHLGAKTKKPGLSQKLARSLIEWTWVVPNPGAMISRPKVQRLIASQPTPTPGSRLRLEKPPKKSNIEFHGCHRTSSKPKTIARPIPENFPYLKGAGGESGGRNCSNPIVGVFLPQKWDMSCHKFRNKIPPQVFGSKKTAMSGKRTSNYPFFSFLSGVRSTTCGVCSQNPGFPLCGISFFS